MRGVRYGRTQLSAMKRSGVENSPSSSSIRSRRVNGLIVSKGTRKPRPVSSTAGAARGRKRHREDEGPEMAEATSLICDYCSRDAAATLTLRIGQQNYRLDVCDKHLSAITSKARKPRRGRRPKSSAATSR